MSYVISVGGDPINPNPFTYSQISMSANIALVWPSNTEDATYTATNWIDITSSLVGLSVALPPANQEGTGAEVVFNNYGSNSVTINADDGSNITTIASGETKRVWITDNSTNVGTWRVANIGSGTTQADASMLAGYGLVAQSGLLSQSMPPLSYSSNATISAGARAALVKWTGGAGTLTLSSPATLGSNWFFNISNSGSGLLVVDGNGANIDTSATVSISPGQGFIIATDGISFTTIGKPLLNSPNFTLLTKSVGGGSNVTLTSSEAVYSIIYFTGVLTGNINIIVPAAVNEWVMFNNTTGAFTLTVKTALGTGVAISQGTRRILNCDGTNVTFSDSVGTGTVTSIATGTGLSGGTITSSGTISLANTAVVAGSYLVLNATIDAQGRITAASSNTAPVLQYVRTPTTLGSTLEIQAYTGTTYTSLATVTANNPATMNLADSVTKANAYIYRAGGTDIPVTDGGTGLSTLTLNNVILGNGASSPQFVAPGSSGNILTSNGTTWVSSTFSPNTSQSSPANPAATSSTTGVMMGLAGSITPSNSGRIIIIASGDMMNSLGGANQCQVQIRYGTGSAPTNGAALAGTSAGGLVKGTSSNNNFPAPFSLNSIISGLTPSTAYWIDISLAAISGGSASIADISISVYELK